MKTIVMDFPAQLESERLLLRSPRPGDGPVINAALRESWPELKTWMIWAAAEPPAVYESEAWAREGYARFVTRRDLPLLVFLKDGKTLVGSSGLHRIDWSVPRFEIGYWLHTAHTGRGYMTEAVATMTRFAFDTLGARRVEIRMDARNTRSAAVPQRLGFVHEGTLKHWRRHHLTNELVDVMVFAQTRPDTL